MMYCEAFPRASDGTQDSPRRARRVEELIDILPQWRHRFVEYVRREAGVPSPGE
jgi:hypothetical protein